MKKKQILSLLLCFSLLFSLLPSTALAEEVEAAEPVCTVSEGCLAAVHEANCPKAAPVEEPESPDEPTTLEEDTGILDISQGSIRITSTGYSVNGGAETAYTGAYIITGTASSKTITIAVQGEVNLTLSFLTMSSASNLNIQSGTVNVELDGANLIQANQDGGGNAVNIADGAHLHFYDSDSDGGSIKLHGASNYWGGSAAVSGGNLYIHSGTVSLIGGNVVNGPFGNAFDGQSVTVAGGTLNCYKGVVSATTGGSITVSDGFTVDANAEFTVLASTILTIPEGAELTNNGTLYNYGTIVVNGTLTNNGTAINCGTLTANGAIVGSRTISTHDYDKDGFCEMCGGIQPAVRDEENNRYEIWNVAQLYWFAGLVNHSLEDGTPGNVNANALLMADIDLAGYDWYPIGQYSDSYIDGFTNHQYGGTFDGNFHVIRNLTVSPSVPCECGLFGRVHSGTVKNLGIENASITSNHGTRIGVFAGECGYGGQILNCYSAGEITLSTTASQAGGIAGESYQSTITHCYTTYHTLTGLNRTAINNSYCSADISESEYGSGALAWRLNGNTAEDSSIWQQNIGVNAYPTFSGGLVYLASTCMGALYEFTNTPTQQEDYHLVDTGSGSPYTLFTDHGLMLSADLQNSKGDSFTRNGVTYQWYETDQYGYTIPISGATGKTYDVPATATAGTHVYRVRATYQTYYYEVVEMTVVFNAPTYTVTIPAEVELGGTVTVSASGVNVAADNQLVVSISGTGSTDNAFKVETDEGAELKYTVTNGGNAVNVNGTVLTVPGGTANSSGTASLAFALAPGEVVKYSGTYKGTVTFAIAVEEVNTP